ncbi:MAG: TIGR01212 family radical SAM protein [Bacteroidia bacterium]|nr:MAG: TIGR01212 family radical SAM protein [Bacteroidia bacterium]
MYPWGNHRRFNSWSDAIRKRFNTRLQKLSINAGFTCPNRDGTAGWGGCTFCNNKGFNPSYCDPGKPIHKQIDEGLTFIRKRYPRASLFLAYFQAYSNTHAPLNVLKEVYHEALSHPGIFGLVIGTRPDCVDDEKLDYLAELSQKHFIKVEYGVESCYDETLRLVNRGHNFEDSRRAIEATSARNIQCGIHMIFGLPGESREMMLAQAEKINALPVDTIKFHQLQIVKDTEMAREYLRKPDSFRQFDLEEYVDFMVAFLERLRPGIAIERFSGEVPPRYILGKRWANVRSDTVIGMIEQRLSEKDTFQGRLCV